VNTEAGVLGKNYTIGHQPGIVGTYLLIQAIRNTTSAVLSPAEISVKAGIMCYLSIFLFSFKISK
jgi:hypothetical protein